MLCGANYYFRAGEVSIRHFIGMPLILVERTGMNLQNEET